MSVPCLSEVDRAAVASAAAAAALQLAEDMTFPLLDRTVWERVRCELRDGFLPVIDQTFANFPNEEGRPTTAMAGARDQDQ